jgi:hypothetical protein
VTFSDINRLNTAPLDQLNGYLPSELRTTSGTVIPQEQERAFDLKKETLLTAAYLNHICEVSQSSCQKRFVCQDQLCNDERYYEEIIFEDDVIPTRAGTWHDFFNGLMWLSFTKTKAYMNQLHIEQTKQHGLVPRTKVRNHITHFDECGIVLFVDGEDLLQSLHTYFSMQNWEAIFIALKESWHQQILPVVIGHANYEMLLKPFIGLTGKVLLVPAPPSVIDMSEARNRLKSWPGNHLDYDKVLHTFLSEKRIFEQSKPFYPLPLLGVPGWHYEQQTPEFYANKQYFMPKRQA